MGMFDSVYVTCPDCGTREELQTKAGDCLCYTYILGQDVIPPEIIRDLENERVLCADCGISRVLKTTYVQQLILI